MAKPMPTDLGQVERLAPVALATDDPVSTPPMAIDRGAKQRRVPLHRIRANPDQPRRRFDGAEIMALAESIAAHGLVQPIVVRQIGSQSLEIVAGERRYRALQLLQRGQRLPKGGVQVLVRKDMSDTDAQLCAYAENAHRAELNPVEDAEALGRIVEERTRLNGQRPTVRDLEDLLPPGRNALAETLQIYKALQDPQLGTLVRQADGAGKSMLINILRVSDFATKCELLRLVADGAKVQDVRSHLAKVNAKPKAGRPKQTLTRTERGEHGYDLSVRVRADMGKEETERALKALGEVTADLRRRLGADAQ